MLSVFGMEHAVFISTHLPVKQMTEGKGQMQPICHFPSVPPLPPAREKKGRNKEQSYSMQN